MIIAMERGWSYVWSEDCVGGNELNYAYMLLILIKMFEILVYK